MTQKVDFKKTLESYQAKRGEFRVLDVPPLRYLMIDGHGDPNTSPAYTEALGALYPVAYKLKFASKRELGRDYVVVSLEGLWWADDMDAFTAARDKSRWDWTMMLMVPDWVDEGMFRAAVEQVRGGGSSRSGARPGSGSDGSGAKDPVACLDEVRFELLSEGRCVQTLHVGSFDDEGAVLDRMHHEFIPEQGLRMAGKHHEVYLSDFRRVEAAKLRTILRQPVVEEL